MGQIVLVFIASLVLHAKDMPEQEGAPGTFSRDRCLPLSWC